MWDVIVFIPDHCLSIYFRFLTMVKKRERRKSIQKKRWKNNTKKWSGMDFAGTKKAAKDRTGVKGLS